MATTPGSEASYNSRDERSLTSPMLRLLSVRNCVVLRVRQQPGGKQLERVNLANHSRSCLGRPFGGKRDCRQLAT